MIMNYAEADPAGQARLSALRDRLHKLGWIEGNNIQIEVRWAAGKSDRMRADAAEFVHMPVNIIVANSTLLLDVLKPLTQTIPIVFAQVADPVAAALSAAFRGQAETSPASPILIHLSPENGLRSSRKQPLLSVVSRFSWIPNSRTISEFWA